MSEAHSPGGVGVGDMGRARRAGRSRLLAALAVVVVASVGVASEAAALPQQGNGDADLSGIVTDGSTSAPVSGMAVCLWDGTGGVCYSTGADGGYAFTGLPQGT